MPRKTGGCRSKKQIENKKKEKDALLQQLKKQEQEYEEQLDELEKTSKRLKR